MSDNIYERIVEELSLVAEQHPDMRVVCLDDDDTPMVINCLEYDDEDYQYILTYDPVEKRTMTAKRLLEAFMEQDNEEEAPDPYDIEVFVHYGPGYYWLEDSEVDLFFVHQLGDEQVVAFRMGDETVLDPMDFFIDDEEDDDD